MNSDPNNVYLELEPTCSGFNHHSSRCNTIPRSLIKQLPSRDKDVVFDLKSSNVRRTSSSTGTLYGTLRNKKVTPSMYIGLGEDEVMQVLENDPKMQNLDVVDAAKFQGDTLRDLHYSLTAKRHIKAKLDNNSKKKQKKLGCMKQLKYSLSMKWLHFKNGVKEVISSFALWEKPLRIIEGNFGSSVGSYFRLLRWLLRLNILSFLILFLFVSIPQLLLTNIKQAKRIDMNCTSGWNETSTFSRPPFSPEILLTGGGWFEGTILYYGGYENKILMLIEDLYYNIPLAYLLSLGVNLITVLVFKAYSLGKSYKERFLEHSGMKMNYFTTRVFCGWDFGVTSAKAAQLQSANLYSDLIEHLTRKQKQTVIRSVKEKLLAAVKFIFFNIVALSLLGLTGWLMHYLLRENSIKLENEVLNDLTVSLIVVLITLVVPTILTFMVQYEGYSKRIQLWITMIRSFLLILVILIILCLFWMPGIFTDSTLVKRQCWQTQVGKEIYRLVVMDFIVCCVFNFFGFWIKSVLVKKGYKYFGSAEFDVAWNTWHLLYNQTLCWIGSFFSPLLPLIIIIKMVLMFYIKQASVKFHSLPPEQIWQTYNAKIVFLAISFFALIFSMIGLGFVINVPSSLSCGPFREFVYPYDVVTCVTQLFHEYKNEFGIIAEYVTKPGFVTIIIVFLCCFAYYSRALKAANLKMMDLLKNQLILEGKDKVFLLRMFDKSIKSMQTKTSSATNTPKTVFEASNYELNSSNRTSEDEAFNRPSTSKMTYPFDIKDENTPSPAESVRRSNFPRKASIPTEHRILAENSPLSSRRRRQTSVPSDSELEYSNVELNPYRSHESLRSNQFVNQAFRDESPFKSMTPPYHDSMSPLPGVSHQLPFQNLGKTRRSSRN